MKKKRDEEIRRLLRGWADFNWATVAERRLHAAASDLLVELDVTRAALVALQATAAARRQLDRDWDARDDVPVSIAGEERLERLNAEVDAAIAHADVVLGDGS